LLSLLILEENLLVIKESLLLKLDDLRYLRKRYVQKWYSCEITYCSNNCV